MIPLYKLFSLLLRVFSRPAINYTKKYHASRHSEALIYRFFYRFGCSFHRFQTFINRRYLKVSTTHAVKQIGRAMAVQKGIQAFYDIIFYSIAIGLPVYELYRAAVDSKARDEKLKHRIERISENFNSIDSHLDSIQHHLTALSTL